MGSQLAFSQFPLGGLILSPPILGKLVAGRTLRQGLVLGHFRLGQLGLRLLGLR